MSEPLTLLEKDARILELETALRDALSTFRADDLTTIVTVERQEARTAALKGTT